MAFPLVLLLVWIGFQLVFVFFANRVALAAAEEGARAARSYTGSAAAGDARAHKFLTELGSGVLVEPTVRAYRTPERAGVVVEGRAQQLVPGLSMVLRVHRAAEGPVERFRGTSAMTRHRSWLRDERGSMALELVAIVPLIVLLWLVGVFALRMAVANGDIEAAARDAARSASIARSAAGAQTAAARSATSWPAVAASAAACRWRPAPGTSAPAARSLSRSPAPSAWTTWPSPLRRQAGPAGLHRPVDPYRGVQGLPPT